MSLLLFQVQFGRGQSLDPVPAHAFLVNKYCLNCDKDDVRKAFPYLDWVDRKLWPKTPVQNDPNFPKIDAVVVLGEPLNWEGALQLILDVIQTDGRPGSKPPANVNQIPVLASNMDLQVNLTVRRWGGFEC